MKEELVKLVDEFLKWNDKENLPASMSKADPKNINVEPTFSDFVKWLKESE